MYDTRKYSNLLDVRMIDKPLEKSLISVSP